MRTLILSLVLALPAAAESNLRIVVEAEHAGQRRSADFVSAEASQANYVLGGERSFAADAKGGKGVEFKKHGFIVNVLPTVDGDRVTLQLQVELSGPVAGAQGAQDVETWQYQGTVTVRKGRKFAFARGATRGEVTVTDAEE